MTERSAFSEFVRTQNLAIDAAQDHALYEQPLGISAQLGDPSVHRIVMRSVERAPARRAQQRPSRIGIEQVAMDAFVPYIHAVERALPEAARKIVSDTSHIAKPQPVPVLAGRSTYTCRGTMLLVKRETLCLKH